MDTNAAMREVVARAGLSHEGACALMGRSPSWLSATLARPGSSTASVLAELADVCGYTLALIPATLMPDEAIVIDPAPRTSQ